MMDDAKSHEERVPEPPPSYSYRTHINSHKNDTDFVPGGAVGYGSTLPTVLMDDCSTQPLLYGQTPGDDNSLTQGYQEFVFSHFVCILLLFGCCMLIGIISVSLNIAMSILMADFSFNSEEIQTIDPEGFWQIIQSMFAGAKGVLVVFPTPCVPILACCCCLGMKSPRGNFCIRVTFYISTATIGSILFIIMLSEVLLSWSVIETNTFGIYSSTVGYYLLYSLTCVDILAVILCLAMIISAVRACIKDPQRMCSNQFIQVAVYIKFLFISAILACVLTSIPAMITLSSIGDIYSPPKNIKLKVFISAAISFNGAHFILVLLFVCLVGPLFCILEIRKSPLFSTILKYIITLSWVISFTLFASGVLSVVSSRLTHELRNELELLHSPESVVGIFALSAVVNFTVTMIITIIWFLCTCNSCVHAIVLCCCLFYNFLI